MNYRFIYETIMMSGTMIDDNEDNGELEMENEGNNGVHDDHDSDNGEEIDDNPEV